jgi:hypothetical protein
MNDEGHSEQDAGGLGSMGSELVENIMSHLTHREAAGARMTSRGLRAACRALERGVGGMRHRYRLVVGSSGSSTLVEFERTCR